MKSARISIGGLGNKYHTPLYILITITLFTILSIIILSIRFVLTGAVGNEGIVILNDSGIASLTSVNIDKLGSTNSDGSPITVTYSDGSTLTPNRNATNSDGTNKNEVLNNDEVVYDVSLNITTPGQITLSLIMPANNVINEASVSEANGCLSGSKVESADITNSDGAITKSYTNNKATCIINPTTTGSLTWSVSANPWGGNNEQITPTIAISNQTQSTTTSNAPIPTVTTIGKGDYGMAVGARPAQGAHDGYDYNIFMSFGLYAISKRETGVIGISPLQNGSWSVDVDTSDLPDGWEIYYSSRGYSNILAAGRGETSMLESGSVFAEQSSDGSSVVVGAKNSATAVLHCPSRMSSGESISSQQCYYSGVSVAVKVPVESLSAELEPYSVRVSQFTVNIFGGDDTIVSPSPESYTWYLSGEGYGNPKLWGFLYLNNPGWVSYYASYQPVYTGETVSLGNWVQLNTNPAGNIVNNLMFCSTWNPSQVALVSEFVKSDESSYKNIIIGDYKVQYGIIGTDMSVLPSSSQQYCGKVGDENIPGQMMFFDTLEEANTYAKQNGLAVNAMRLWSAETTSGLRDGVLGGFDMALISTTNTTTGLREIKYNASATSDEWTHASDGADSDAPHVITQTLAPGLLSHTITAIPSSTVPNAEDHITITTKTYNKDTNSKITTILPNGLIPKAGSFTITNKEGNKLSLTEGDNQDYTLSSGCYAN